MGLPDVTTATTSRLRDLHEAIVEQLGETFGPNIVKAHSASVTPDSIRRYSQNKFAIWAVIGSADGLDDSPATEMRMRTRWGVFIVASPVHEVPDPLEPDRTRAVPAAMVALTIANYVVRLAHQTTWGMPKGTCAQCLPSTVSIRNLGVGLKSAQEFVEQEDLGLFVVWGNNDLSMGEIILPGNEQLPPFDVVQGAIQSFKGDEEPDVEFKVGSAFVALVQRLWGAVLDAFRPSWPAAAAREINAEIEREFGHAQAQI